MLIYLASGCKNIDLVNMSRISFYHEVPGRLTIKWVESFRAKNERSFTPENPSIAELVLNGTANALCSVRAFKFYLKASKAEILRRKLTLKYLWVPLKGNRPINELALANLFKSVVDEANRSAGFLERVSISPHQMRKLSAAYSFWADQEPEVIRLRMGFSAFSVLLQHYVADVPDLEVPCVLPGGLAFPIGFLPSEGAV